MSEDELSFWEEFQRVLHGLKQPRESGEYRHARFQVTRVVASFSGTMVMLVCVAGMFLLWREPAAASVGSTTAVTFVQPVEPVEDIPTDQPMLNESTADLSDATDMGGPGSESDLSSGAVDAPVTDLTAVGDATVSEAPIGPNLLRNWNPGVGIMTRQVGGGGDGGLGYTNGMAGDLVGVMYDLKRNGKGGQRTPSFTHDVKKIVESGFSVNVLKNYFRVPKPVYLTHLFVPYAEAVTGPRSFGVEKLMQPSKWIVHYSGVISAPSAGQYRLAGDFDDVLIVMIDGKVVLEANWGDSVTKWKPRENVGSHESFTSHALTYGDWVALAPHQKRRLDILVGEDPGGMVGGVLLVEKKERRYPVDASGRPVLPIFAVQPLTKEENERLRNFDKWSFASMTPVMAPVVATRRGADDDVEITISSSAP